jgi:hypothetical protein
MPVAVLAVLAVVAIFNVLLVMLGFAYARQKVRRDGS